MNQMVQKYEEMRQKLEWTRQTLTQTSSQIAKHDSKRASQIRLTVTRLKERAENCSGKLRQIRERNEREGNVPTDVTTSNDNAEFGSI